MPQAAGQAGETIRRAHTRIVRGPGTAPGAAILLLQDLGQDADAWQGMATAPDRIGPSPSAPDPQGHGGRSCRPLPRWPAGSWRSNLASRSGRTRQGGRCTSSPTPPVVRWQRSVSRASRLGRGHAFACLPARRDRPCARPAGNLAPAVRAVVHAPRNGRDGAHLETPGRQPRPRPISCGATATARSNTSRPSCRAWRRDAGPPCPSGPTSITSPATTRPPPWSRPTRRPAPWRLDRGR